MAGIAFTTAYSQPATVTGLVITTDPATSLVTLEWTATALALGVFDAYVVERQVGAAPWQDIGEQRDRDTPTFTDSEAPAGVLVRYRVRVSIGATGFDSEPLEGDITPEGQYAVVVLGDTTLTRGRLPIRFGVTQSRPVEQSWPRPLGRTKPLLSEEAMTGNVAAQITASMVITPARQELAELIWQWERVRPWLLFKDKRGHVWRVIFHGAVLNELNGGDALQASWSATEVA